MKKTYIIPTTKGINLAFENALLVDSLTGNEGTIGNGSGDVEETRRQQGGNSLWDTWSN